MSGSGTDEGAGPPPWPDGFETSDLDLGLGVVLPDELHHRRHTLQAALLKDRRNLGVGDEALPTLLTPVEDHPDAVVLGGIARDVRALGPVLPSLLSALGGKGVLKRSKSSIFDVARIMSLLLCGSRRALITEYRAPRILVWIHTCRGLRADGAAADGRPPRARG